MKKKALFFAGGWEEHTPFESAEFFAALLREENYSVEISDTLDVLLDQSKLNHLDLIVPVWTMSTITFDQVSGLLNAVRSGVGIAGWHGTMADSFRDSVEYQFMVGGQWVAHPGDFIEYTVNVTDPDHPITAGIDDFKIKSEQYYMHVDPSNHTLATTTFSGDFFPWIEGATIPVMWTRMWGAGKVAYCSLGHSVAEFEVPEVREMVRRSLVWASK